MAVGLDPVVVAGVVHLTDRFTDPEKYGNRETRKRLECERLSSTHPHIQNIKLCDMLSNAVSIVKHDEDFAKVFMKEFELLVKVLNKANSELKEVCNEYIDKYFSS